MVSEDPEPRVWYFRDAHRTRRFMEPRAARAPGWSHNHTDYSGKTIRQGAICTTRDLRPM